MATTTESDAMHRSIFDRWSNQSSSLPATRVRLLFLGVSFLIVLGLSAMWTLRRTTPTLRVFVWKGYADETVIAPFEHRYNCYVSVRYMDTSDQLYQDLKNGADYDVVSASSDIADDIRKAGLSAQLDRKTRVRLRDLADPSQAQTNNRTSLDDRVPFMWGPNVLIYVPSAFGNHPPSSWSILWNSKLAGRVAVWDDLSSLYMAAQLDHLPVYQLRSEDLHKLERERLRSLLMSNHAHLWSDAAELTTMFRDGQIVAALGWPLTVSDLRKLKVAVAATIPIEGTTGWIDYLLVPARSRNKALAFEFVRYLLTSDVQARVASITHYEPVDGEAKAVVSEKKRPDEAYSLSTIAFWRSLGDNRDSYLAVWQQAKADSVAQSHTDK